jgi:hypothetical protein
MKKEDGKWKIIDDDDVQGIGAMTAPGSSTCSDMIWHKTTKRPDEYSRLVDTDAVRVFR